MSSQLTRIKENFYIRRFVRLLRPYSPARPVWRKTIKSHSFPKLKKNAHKVLVATSTGSHWAMSGFESVLVAALKLRGASIETLLCDGVLPACQECDVRLFPDNRLFSEGVSPICKTCFKPAEKMFSELGVVVRRYSEFIHESQRKVLDSLVETIADKDLKKYVWSGIPVGEHAIAGALRFFGRGTLSGEKFGFSIARQFFRAALYTAAVMEKMLSQKKYDVVVFHHGIYVPQGVIGDVCRKYGVRVVNWNPAYRDRSFIFSHGDSYHKTMIEESSESCLNFEWNPDKDSVLMEYLSSRSNGSNDWISFQKHSQSETTELLKELNIDHNRPVVGLLTNVLWDAQLHFKANAFSSMLEWIFFTIDYFSRRSDIQLLIRIHPAEVLGTVPSRQLVFEEIKIRWPTLPNNIHIVAPEDPKNTYALMKACDTVLVYGTKMSIELPCWGIPVVVAGEAWVRGKGFTTDVNSIHEYKEILSALPKRQRMKKSVIEIARRYAYYLFFRRMIPVKFAKKNGFLVPFSYNIKSLDELATNVDPGLDVICKGIILGTPFLVN